MSLYGRKLYEIMSAYWPTAEEQPGVTPVAVDFAKVWKATPRVVFSSTLESVGWNSRLHRGDVVEETRRLKAEDGADLEIGGATLAAPVVRAGLIDEFHLFFYPVVIGGGTPFFPLLDNWINLRRVETREFASAVFHRYEVRR
jgi:dihydrofolate reductase